MQAPDGARALTVFAVAKQGNEEPEIGSVAQRHALSRRIGNDEALRRGSLWRSASSHAVNQGSGGRRPDRGMP